MPFFNNEKLNFDIEKHSILAPHFADTIATLEIRKPNHAQNPTKS